MRIQAPLFATLVLGLVLAGCGRSPLATAQLAQVAANQGTQAKAIGCLPGDCGSIIRPTPRPCHPREQMLADAALPPGYGGGGSTPGDGCGCVGPRAQRGTDAYLPPNQGGGSTPKPPCR